MNPDQNAMDQYLLALGANDPAVMQALVASGLFNEQMGVAGQDYQQGASMFGTPSAEGRNVSGTYVAANPLEHLNTAMSRVMGANQMKDARAQQADYMKQLNDAKIRMLNAQGGPRAPRPAGGMVPPPAPITYGPEDPSGLNYFPLGGR